MKITIPNFNTLYQKGDVVVGGLNFGSGSSREQAATALKFKGIPCVIAASFSETYKRNAFNNGFVVFECPELVTHLRATLTDRAPTTVASEITIDYAKSVLTIDGKSFAFPPLSPAAQELIVAGGAENLVALASARKRIELTGDVACEMHTERTRRSRVAIRLVLMHLRDLYMRDMLWSRKCHRLRSQPRR